MLYDNMNKLNIKKDEKQNLSNLMKIYKNWHFMLFPKYDFEFFTNKIVDLGKKAPAKVREDLDNLFRHLCRD